MAWRDFFVSTSVPQLAPAIAGTTGAAPAAPAGANGEFITPQSLTSFAGATFVSSMLAGIALIVWPDLNRINVAALIAFGVGLVVLGINISDKRVKKKFKETRDWVIAIVVGLINSLYLVAIAIGVFEAVETAIANV